MTAREIIENLKKLPENKLDLPVIVENEMTGQSYLLAISGETQICSKYKEGYLRDMTGEEFVEGTIFYG